MMDLPIHRRPGAIKYGKSRTKVLGYNFFGADVNPATATATTTPATAKFPISPSSPGNTHLTHDEPIEPPESPSRTSSPAIRPAHVTAHSRSSVSTSNGSRSESPLKQAPSRGDSSMFDVLTSEDEHEAQARRPLKRRKLEETVDCEHSSDVAEVQASKKTGRAKRQILARKHENAALRNMKADMKDELELAQKSKAAAEQPTAQEMSVGTVKDAAEPAKRLQKPRAKKATYGKKADTGEKQRSLLPENKDALVCETDVQSQSLAHNDGNGSASAETSENAKSKSKTQLRKISKPSKSAIEKPQPKPPASQGEDAARGVRELPSRGKTRLRDTANVQEKPLPPVTRQKVRTKKATYGERSAPNTTKSSSRGRNQDAVMQDVDLLELADSPLPATVNPEMSTAGTPIQSHPGRDSDTSVASPSRLGLTDLRLTPANSPQPRRSSISSTSSAVASPARRGRARRIDLLDAPQAPASQTASRSVSASRTLSMAKSKLQRALDELESQSSASSRPQLTRSASSQTRQTYGKSKNTYGRERSHLADMVDSLDMLSNGSSQDASQQLVSQLAASSQPSQLQMELELEDSSGDDAAVGGKLKSIHELRQAGTNNRFERDLEMLLEDIDPTPKSASKALRLQALTKLFQKMANEHNFEAFVSDHALDRLAPWSKSVKDKLSKLLFDMIFWRLVHAKNVIPRKLGTIAQVVAASTGFITNLSTIAQIAKDPKENLPRSMLKHLQNFEETVIRDGLLPAYEGDRIVPAAVTIAALNDSLRKLAEASTNNLAIGKTAYEGVIAILKRASQLNADGSLQNAFVTKLALSLLQLFSGPLESDLGLSDSEYRDLGRTLATIVTNSLNEHEDLVQSVLHFAISLCNDRPAVCAAVSSSELGTSLVGIVNSRFLDLVAAANADSSLEPVILDSIILSLACLLNLTEYDDAIRRRFAKDCFDATTTNLARLVGIYAQAAPQLTRAATAEQSQALVAFGYLSLLLCNLCLDGELWQKASRMLGTLTIADVVVSAKELLIHLRTLEMAQLEGEISMLSDAGSGATDGFTQRFEQIISAVRVS